MPFRVPVTTGKASEIAIPATVTIPADEPEVTFDVDAVDDALLDGTQNVAVTASAGGYVSGSDTLDVTDHETLTVEIAADAISENGGATTATVRRSNMYPSFSSLLLALVTVG